MKKIFTKNTLILLMLLSAAQLVRAQVTFSRTQVCAGDTVTATWADFSCGFIYQPYDLYLGTCSYTDGQFTYYLGAMSCSGVTVITIPPNTEGTWCVSWLNADFAGGIAFSGLTITSPLNVNITDTNISCSSVQLTASGGSSYMWSGGNSLYTAADTVTSSGYYYVTAADGAGCHSTAYQQVTFTTATNPGPISGPTSVCALDNITLTNTTAGGIWSSSNPNLATVDDAGNVTGIAAGLDTIIYTVPCATANAIYPVSVTTGISAGITGTANGCGSVILTATGGTGYTWSGGNSVTTAIDTFTNSNTYTVTVTGANGCSALLSQVTTANPIVTAGITGNDTGCGLVTLTATGGTGYRWNGGNNLNSATDTITSSGTYSITVTGAGGCSAMSSQAVTVNPVPAAAIIGSATGCAAVTLTATGGTEYSWSGGSSTTTAKDTFTTSNTYTVTVTGADGCTAIVSKSVTVNAAPSATITANGNTTLCQGDSVTLSANTESTYLWSTDATTQNIAASTAGSYTVKITDANGCTALSNPESVVVNSLPAADITPGGATSFCDGDSVTLTANTANSYLWSNNATTQSISIKQNGSYTVIVTDVNNCSGASSAIIVTVDTLPVAVITATGDTTFCTGGSVILNASPGTVYLWNTGASTQNINAAQTGSYFVTVTNANNCSAVSIQVHVTVNPAPGAIISPASVSFCEGGNATLTAGGGISYTWSNGANTDATVVSPDSTITYTVTVTAANNCTATTSRTVTVNPLPSAAISPSASIAICEGDSQLLSAPEGNPGYLWSTSATTQTIEATFTGNYLVTVTSINNCSAVSDAVALTVNPLPPAPTISRSNDTLTSSIATSYQWYLNDSPIPSANERNLVISDNGSYTVQIADSNGCQNTSAALNITTLGIADINANYNVQLYPNPNNGNFTLQFSDNIPRSVSITDVTGRIIIEAQQMAMHKDFDCAALPGGVYLLQVKENTEVRTFNFVIAK